MDTLSTRCHGHEYHKDGWLMGRSRYASEFASIQMSMKELMEPLATWQGSWCRRLPPLGDILNTVPAADYHGRAKAAGFNKQEYPEGCGRWYRVRSEWRQDNVARSTPQVSKGPRFYDAEWTKPITVPFLYVTSRVYISPSMSAPPHQAGSHPRHRERRPVRARLGFHGTALPAFQRRRADGCRQGLQGAPGREAGR